MSDAFQQTVSILAVEDDPGDFGLIKAYVHLAELGIAAARPPVIWRKRWRRHRRRTAQQARHRAARPVVPDSAGLPRYRRCAPLCPACRSWLLTGHNDNALAAAALHAGAQDYLVKGNSIRMRWAAQCAMRWCARYSNHACGCLK